MSATLDPSIQAPPSDQIELYPTIARRLPGQPAWQIIVQGRVVRIWRDNLHKRLVQRLLKRTLKMNDEEIASPIFEERISAFWVKPQRRRRVTVQIDDVVFELSKRSKGSGHFQAPLNLPFDMAGHNDDRPGNLILQSGSTGRGRQAASHQERSATVARLIPPCGTSVISDIDDTIKISNVSDRRQLIANTFLRPFTPVAGMADTYRRWSEAGCEFHYVSSSPWQLISPLDRFINEYGFPNGSYHLRSFRLRDPNNLRMMLAGARSKRRAIRSLLKLFPFRQFVLIGDGGEEDARLYGKLAQKHGHQIAQVCIRRLPDATGEGERRTRMALDPLPRIKWRMFEHGDELSDLIAGNSRGWQFSD